MTEISIADSAAILTLVVATMAVAIAPTAYFFEQTRKKLGASERDVTKAIEELQRQYEVTQEMVDATAELCEAMDSKTVLVVGLVERALAKAGESNAFREQMRGEIAAYDRTKDQCLNELLLFSRDSTKCLSAMQVLSQQIGTGASLRRMRLATRRVKVEQSLVQGYADALEKRLNKRH